MRRHWRRKLREAPVAVLNSGSSRLSSPSAGGISFREVPFILALIRGLGSPVFHTGITFCYHRNVASAEREHGPRCSSSGDPFTCRRGVGMRAYGNAKLANLLTHDELTLRL